MCDKDKPATKEEKKDACIGCKYCVSKWSKIFHAIQYIGTGFLFSFIALYLLQAYAPKILNIETVTVNKGSSLPTLLNSYQAIITSYYNTICVFFGIFALLSISSFMLNKYGAEKVDKEYEKARTITENYKEQLDKQISNFEIKISDALQEIKDDAERERRISQTLSDAYNEYSKKTPEGYNSAISISDSIISQYGNIPSAYFLKGNAQYNKRNYEEAMKCYDKAIKINPEDNKAYFNKGNALNALDKHEEAIECYDKAIKINPSIQIDYNMACLYSLWHTSKTDIKNKPINCLEKCKEHLILAMQSGELSKLGISHIKNDHDLVNVKDLDWFNDIMREAFGKDEWDNYKEEPNKETE